MPDPLAVTVGLGRLLTFPAPAFPLAMRSRPKLSNGWGANGGTDEISISACDSDRPGRLLRYVGLGFRLQRSYHDQPQRTQRAWCGICQGRDAAGRLQGQCHRLPTGLVQDPWRRCQRLGQFRLSRARPCRAPAGRHRAPAALAQAAPSSSSAPSPAAQAASRQVQDRARLFLQIGAVASDRACRLPRWIGGRWPQSVLFGRGPDRAMPTVVSGARQSTGTSAARAR